MKVRIIVILFVLCAPLSVRAQDLSPNPPQPKSTEQSSWQYLFEWCETHDKGVVAISAGVTAVFTVVLSIATIGLWVATKNVWLAGDRNAERELRAYVSVTKAEVTQITPERIEVVLDVENAGRTPAHDLEIGATIDIGAVENYPFRELPTSPGHRSRSALGPNGVVEVERHTVRPLPMECFRDILLGTKSIFVFGEIHYRDAFNNRRLSTFRFAATGNPNNPEAEVSLVTMEDGNTFS